MGTGSVSLLSGLVILGFVSSQEFFEEHRHMARLTLDRIPREFEIKGNINAKREFEKFSDRIHHLAKAENKSIVYKVKVEVVKHHTKGNIKKINKKGKSKKFNVPLKKNSMKMSNFEALVKKMAEQNNHQNQPRNNFPYNPMTTESQKFTTRLLQVKYKPIVSKLNKFTKIVRPVKNRIITLKN